jgi:hypothetical protein
MAHALVDLQTKIENMKKEILRKYSDNKKLARNLIKGAEQTADYEMQASDPPEKWYVYFLEELRNRL